jgi:hypothetical protein
MKFSADKKTHPFAKQIYRRTGSDGKFKEDLIVRDRSPLASRDGFPSPLSLGGRDGGEGEGDNREGEAPAEPMLIPIMRQGRLLRGLPSLDASREHCRQQLARLPDELLQLEPHQTYPVRFSSELENAAPGIVDQSLQSGG